MTDLIGMLLDQLAGSSRALVYFLLGVFAALENLIPPVPADVVVLFGGFLAGQGVVDAFAVFLIVWFANVAGALAVYFVGHHYGTSFFSGRWGRLLLKPRQLESLDLFYRKYGFRVIFLSRFLPMFRAVVPVFAGISNIGFWRTAIPLAFASAIWYGVIVYLGAVAGQNWEAIVASLEGASRWFWTASLFLLGLVLVWWWRTRGEDGE